MKNPYEDRPDYTFWRRAVSGIEMTAVDPVVSAPFPIFKSDRVATAGSCFAQHIARALKKAGFTYFVTESSPPSANLPDENYGTFSARFGNIYTTLQLIQLFDRAFGLFSPSESCWQRPDGAFIDPFRPQIQQAAFRSIDELSENRSLHLGAVRTMFEDCDVFVFTLGLTEAWVSKADRAAVPLAPGVAGGGDIANYRFENLEVSEMTSQLLKFIEKLRSVNPQAKVILTVSPVPLIATYEDRHVLISTTYSKAALRVVADTVARAQNNVSYFPSFEIITGAHTRGAFFAENLRDVTEEGVNTVMSLFFKHFAREGAAPELSPDLSPSQPPQSSVSTQEERFMREVQEVICDEEAIDPEVSAAKQQ